MTALKGPNQHQGASDGEDILSKRDFEVLLRLQGEQEKEEEAWHQRRDEGRDGGDRERGTHHIEFFY